MHLGGIIVLFLVSVFWLAKHPEWVPFVDFVFQFFLFCLLGKIVLVPTFWLGVVLKNWHIPLFGFSLMVSVFIRWMLVLVFDFKVANTFQIVETWYGIPRRHPSGALASSVCTEDSAGGPGKMTRKSPAWPQWP